MELVGTADGDKSRPKQRRSPRNKNVITPSGNLADFKKKMKSQLKETGSQILIKDSYAVAQGAKHLIKKQTGLIFDESMVDHFCLWDPNYPECPGRLTSILNRCKELNLIERCERIASRRATDEEILTKHTLDHLNRLKETAGEQNAEQLETLSSKFDAVFVNSESYDKALLSAGSAIDLVGRIIGGFVQNGMAIIRPPGHHAMSSEYCGYCFFNNVALAAQSALDQGLSRVLIVDWDVHHGQASQQMFYDDPRVLYFSIHRYEHGSFWPNLRESNFDYIGEGAGRGFNINVPLNATGMTDEDYLAIFHWLLLPVAYEFCPDLVIVSAGFDSAFGDAKGLMNVTPACYAKLTSYLMGLAQGKLAVILEGGYFLPSLAESAAFTLKTLLGDPVPTIGIKRNLLNAELVETLQDLLSVLSAFWKNLNVLELKRSHRPIQYLWHEDKPENYATRDCYPTYSEEEVKKFAHHFKHVICGAMNVPKERRVGILYDEGMTEHENVHETDHPEKPQRIRAIYQMHQEFGLLDRCIVIKPTIVTDINLNLIHDEKYIKDIEEIPRKSQSELDVYANNYDSVYLNPKSYDSALLAAKSSVELIDKVLKDEITSAVGIIRPPGHHAEIQEPCGFCIFNNAALAARYAANNGEKVCLLDWDVHHGNGTQRIFESDPNVLYISLHRYNHGKFFPSSQDANFDRIGKEAGIGFNVNIPWNKSGGNLNDSDYISAFFTIVLPILTQFQPTLIIVSAGFDACVNDPLGHCKVSPEAFGHMTHWLTTFAGGRVVLLLEGGYNITSISYAMTMCTKALLGDPLPALEPQKGPCLSAVESVRNVIGAQEKYWMYLSFGDFLENNMKNLTLKTCADDNHSKSGCSQSDLSTPQTSSSSFQSENRPKTVEEYLQENLQQLLAEEMFAIVPLKTCPHLDQVNAVPKLGIDVRAPCQSCNSASENWTCLTCYAVQCGRHVNGHMLEHSEEQAHPLTVSFADLSVWCYGCEGYVDNPVLYEARNAVHKSKFSTELVWTYGSQN